MSDYSDTLNSVPDGHDNDEHRNPAGFEAPQDKFGQFKTEQPAPPMIGSMNIIVGHTNMDLDCIGSIVLARYLSPDHVPVKSYMVHPVARNLMNMYEERLGFATSADLKGQAIEHAVVVDTAQMGRIAEYLRGVPHPDSIAFEVFDHHPAELRDIQAAVVHERLFGANTTQLLAATTAPKKA